jgi:alternate signal-mediated exported protein
MWSTDVPVGTAVITAGNLDLRAQAPQWYLITHTEDSADHVEEPINIATYRAPRGDLLEVHIPITTTLVGDNLNAELVADLVADEDSGLSVLDHGGRRGPAPAITGFRLTDRKGVQVAPASGIAELGESVLLSASAGGGAAGGGTAGDGTQDWLVILSIEVGGEFLWTTPDQASADRPSQWRPGDILLSLDQVRHGSGFIQDES